VLFEFLKPCWSGQIFEVVWVLSLMSKSFSSTLDIVLSREIGRWLTGLDKSLPGFGIMMTVACFYGSGK